jgi:TRAP-type C4-dicarboxylate transport system permease large subunit
MNYIKEVNAFYDWLETNSMAVSSIALWHALMNICNKAGWPREFAVAVLILSAKTGLERRTIYNARNELKQKGRIDFKERRGTNRQFMQCTGFMIIWSVKIAVQNLHTKFHAMMHTIVHAIIHRILPILLHAIVHIMLHAMFH